MNDVRKQFVTDFPFYARNCLNIRTKAGSIEPLLLNSAQQQLHDACEDQIARTGRVRKVVLKGRQMGLSTYVEGRFMWRTTHSFGVKTYVLTHVASSTTALFDMSKRYFDLLPPVVKPTISKNNSNELVFDNLQSSFKVGTAGSANAGRGETIQLAHFSEVAFWPNQEEIIAGLMQAIPDMPGTEIILESTANGATGYFYDVCQRALRGEGDFELVFIPWFKQSEYQRPFTNRVVLNEEDFQYQQQYGLSNEQMAWRYFKTIELTNAAKFRQEYPATVEEAFRADVTGALWKRSDINRWDPSTPLPRMVRHVVALDPATTSKKHSDETGFTLWGECAEGNAYLLKDLSGKHSITDWTGKLADICQAYDVDRIIAETNQGGDFVLERIRNVAPQAHVEGIHVSDSKRVRHEQAWAQYKRGKVFHVGEFPLLEDAMCTWIPYGPNRSQFSPDRVDSACLGIDAILLGPAHDIGDYIDALF